MSEESGRASGAYALHLLASIPGSNAINNVSLLLVAAQHASFGQSHFCYHTGIRTVALNMGQAFMPESAADRTAMSPDRYVIVCVHEYMYWYVVFVYMHVHKVITVCLCGTVVLCIRQ